jgi:hypothetical protein
MSDTGRPQTGAYPEITRQRDNSSRPPLRRRTIDYLDQGAIDYRDHSHQRRYVDPTACDAEFAAAVEEFQQAMEQYKQSSGRMFPTWCEVLEVLEGLRYRKVGHEAAGPPGRCGHDPDDRGWPPRR